MRTDEIYFIASFLLGILKSVELKRNYIFPTGEQTIMAVVGFDFGNDSCYISVARQGGIETIANDYSLRDTSSFVAFGERQRILGVGAKSQFLTNLKRTVFGFKHLLGRSFSDPVAQDIISSVPYKISEGPGGSILIQVSYGGQERSFTPEEMTAMLMTKLKETAEDVLKTKVKDCVIGCPCYFTDRERRALLDAAAIAGLIILMPCPSYLQI